MRPLPRWRLRREPMCWWPGRLFSTTAKASPPPCSGCGPQFSANGVGCHAARDDRIGQDGRQYGAAPYRGRPSVRRLRHVAEGGRRLGAGQGSRGHLACRPRAQAGEAACGLADGPGRCRGQDDCRPGAPYRARRHSHQPRQFVLRVRHPPRSRPRVEGDQLRGRRDQRRRVGPGARLLHDDRRTGCGRAASRSDLQDAGAWCGRHPAYSRARAHRRHGYLHCGPNGAGHFVKMVHNGIEYGIMAAYAEGLSILRHANVGEQQHAVDAETTPLRNPELYRYDLNLRDVAEVWRRGSVIASWLLDLTATALTKDPALENFAGRVSDSGEGRWTIKAAIDAAVPVPVLSTALYERFSSRGEAMFGDKLLSAMRYEFGGHVEKAAG